MSRVVPLGPDGPGKWQSPNGGLTELKHSLDEGLELVLHLGDCRVEPVSHQALLLRLLADLTLVSQEIEAQGVRGGLICIEEIQKCPQLLDEVNLLIEEPGVRFLLAGSSARKLRK